MIDVIWGDLVELIGMVGRNGGNALICGARRSAGVELVNRNGGNASISGLRRVMANLIVSTDLGQLSGSPDVAAGGCDPLRPAISLPSPVAHGSDQAGETFSESGQNRQISPCLASASLGKGAEIPPFPMGSGVRAAQCAGLNIQSWCRPKFLEALRQSGGLGVGWSQSCAKGLNMLWTLGRGTACVN
jgi:hypothetical protein